MLTGAHRHLQNSEYMHEDELLLKKYMIIFHNLEDHGL